MQIKNGAFYKVVKNYLETSRKLANFEDLMTLFENKKPNKTTLYRILTRLETANLIRVLPTKNDNLFESSYIPNHLHQFCTICEQAFCTKIIIDSDISSLQKVLCKKCAKTTNTIIYVH